MMDVNGTDGFPFQASPSRSCSAAQSSPAARASRQPSRAPTDPTRSTAPRMPTRSRRSPILNEDFQTTITSSRGMITIFESFGQEVFVDENDFLF
jgi:hypothetical protein